MQKPILIFHADGGFQKWNGSSILHDGVGGSETWVIRTSTYIQEKGIFRVIVFSHCIQEEIFENVEYKNINDYYDFITSNKIHSCIISRYPENLPATYLCQNIENVYLILHDLVREGEIIIDNPSLRKIFCLSNFHRNIVQNMFPSLSNKLTVTGYGIDDMLPSLTHKIPYTFMYSSFPNRGLLKLLKLWPAIIGRYPSATLHVHCDLENSWVNSCVPVEMTEIKELMKNTQGIIYHGWTNKKKLYETWLTTDIWFYPTSFLETFCLTAYEAMISKTLIVCSEVGALKDTVNNHGILIPGNPTDENYDDKALQILFTIMDDNSVKKKYVDLAYYYAKKQTWFTKTNELFSQLMT